MKEYFLPMHDYALTNALPSVLRALESHNSDNPLSIIINVGAVGALLVLYITNYMPSRGEVKLLKEQNAELRSIIAAFQTQSIQTIPALTRSTDVLERIPQREFGYLEEVKLTQAELAEAVKALKQVSQQIQEGRSS